MGVSAPRTARAGSTFIARLAVYVERRENSVAEKLRLANPAALTLLGITPDRMLRWQIGTPVTVRVGGVHLEVDQAERSFEWSGSENILSFLVRVATDTPPIMTQLCFEVFIQGVPIAFVPIDLSVGNDSESKDLTTTNVHLPSTAFASYASADASIVAACISALHRWDNALDVFMDCLDLTPNESWQRELESVIASKDVFLLFWSVNAMRSKWVQWEYETAKATRGLQQIRPMPLDDPELAPPPPELGHLHFRDRYMMARQAFLKIRSAP